MSLVMVPVLIGILGVLAVVLWASMRALYGAEEYDDQITAGWCVGLSAAGAIATMGLLLLVR